MTVSIKSLAIKQEVAFRSNRTPWAEACTRQSSAVLVGPLVLPRQQQTDRQRLVERDRRQATHVSSTISHTNQLGASYLWGCPLGKQGSPRIVIPLLFV